MPENDELAAMRKIAEALDDLDDAAQQRALQWVNSRYRKATGGSFTLTSSSPFLDRESSPATEQKYETFAELFDAANPTSEKEKALVAAYWEQLCKNQPSFGSQSLNTELKDLGHRVGNITEALTSLKNERPSLVLQLKKSGTSRQARKTYKLSQEGVKRVQTMIRDAVSPSET